MSEDVFSQSQNDARVMLRAVGRSIDDLRRENRFLLEEIKDYQHALKTSMKVTESEVERRKKAMDDLGVTIMFMQVMSIFVMLMTGFSVYSWW